MLLNKQEHGWLPTVVVPGAESGGLLADAAHAAMHATRTVKDQVRTCSVLLPSCMRRVCRVK